MRNDVPISCRMPIVLSGALGLRIVMGSVPIGPAVWRAIGERMGDRSSGCTSTGGITKPAALRPVVLALVVAVWAQPAAPASAAGSPAKSNRSSGIHVTCDGWTEVFSETETDLVGGYRGWRAAGLPIREGGSQSVV